MGDSYLEEQEKGRRKLNLSFGTERARVHFLISIIVFFKSELPPRTLVIYSDDQLCLGISNKIPRVHSLGQTSSGGLLSFICLCCEIFTRSLFWTWKHCIRLTISATTMSLVQQIRGNRNCRFYWSGRLEKCHCITISWVCVCMCVLESRNKKKIISVLCVKKAHNSTMFPDIPSQ